MRNLTTEEIIKMQEELKTEKKIMDDVNTLMDNNASEEELMKKMDELENFKKGTLQTKICDEIKRDKKLEENCPLTDEEIEEIGKAINVDTMAKMVKNNEGRGLTEEEIIEAASEEGTLTDEQIEDIVKTLHPVTSETGEEPEHFPHHVLNNKKDLVATEALVEVDPNTGLHKIVGVAHVAENKASFSDIIDGKDEEEMNKITKEQAKGLSDIGLSLSDSDAVKLYEVVRRFQDGEKFNMYEEVPEQVKTMAQNITLSKDVRILNKATKGILQFFVNELNIDKEFIDLQQSIKKELDMDGLVDMYADHLKQSMEVDLLKKAEIAESKGEHEKAELLRRISSTFTNTYNMDLLFLELDSNPKVVKKINKDLKKFNKHCMEFNYKYQNSKFVINDVKLLLSCLKRNLDEKYTEEDIKKFILLFTNICTNMTSKDVVEHTFMYYTIKNILTIDHLEKDNKFKTMIIKNVEEVIEKIKHIEKVKLIWN